MCFPEQVTITVIFPACTPSSPGVVGKGVVPPRSQLRDLRIGVEWFLKGKSRYSPSKKGAWGPDRQKEQMPATGQMGQAAGPSSGVELAHMDGVYGCPSVCG